MSTPLSTRSGTLSVANPWTLSDAIAATVFSLADPLTHPSTAHRARCILGREVMQARVDACASMAMLLRAYGCVANVELRDGWSMLTPTHRTDNVPEDAIGSWGVWTADEAPLMTREDLGCDAGDDADLTLFQSCLPAYLDPRVAVLVQASCVGLGPVFSALLDLEDDAVEHWEIALRVICWMARERRRLSPRMHLACLSVTVGDASLLMQDMDSYIVRFIEGEREKEEEN